MKVLLTGANGLVGRHFIHQPDFEFYAATRRNPHIQGVHWLETDLSGEFDTQNWPQDLDAIVCLAQSNHYRDLPDGAVDLLAVNVMGIARLVKFAGNLPSKPHILLASTGDVYGRGTEAGFREDEAFFQNVAKPNLYPLSRKLAEEYIAGMADLYGLKLSILRFFHIYGPQMAANVLVARLEKSIRDGQPIRLEGESGLFINPTYVTDLSEALTRIIQQEPQREPIEHYNVACDQTLSLRRIADCIGEAIGQAPVYEFAPAGPAPYIAPNVEKFAGHYGPMVWTDFPTGYALSKSDG